MDRTLPQDPQRRMERQMARPVVIHSNRFKRLRQGLREFAQVQNPERAVEYQIKEFTNYKGEITARQLMMKQVCPRYLYKRAKKILRGQANESRPTHEARSKRAVL